MAKDGTLREIARWALLVIIVVGAALVWWKTPTEVQPDNLSLDLQDGKVTVVEVGCLSERFGDGTGLLGFPLVDSPEFFLQESQQVCWTNKSGRSYVADFAPVVGEWHGAAVGSHGRPFPDRFFERSVASTVRTVSPVDDIPSVYQSSGWPLRVVHDRWRSWPRTAVLVSMLGLLAFMIGGRQPRRGTRWGVFWVMLACSGLGTVWYLLREAPWSRSAAALPEPAAGVRQVVPADGPPVARFGGGHGFLVALITTFVAAILLAGLNQLIIDEDPVGDPAVIWSLVGHDGQQPVVYRPYQ